MARVSIRLSPDFADRKRHYPDGPYRALVDCFCAAEYEPVRGQFRSMAILRAVIGRSARFIPFLIQQRDLELTRADQVNVVGWQEWQEGNHPPYERRALVETARAERHGGRRKSPEKSAGALRTAKWRAKNAEDDASLEASLDASGDMSQEKRGDDVTLQDGIAVSGLAVSGKRVSDVTPRPTSEPAKVKAWLREHEIAQPVGWEVSKVNELAKQFGGAAVIASFEEALAQRTAVTCRNYVRWAEQSLSPDRSPNGTKPKGHTRPAEEVVDVFNR